MIVTALVHAVSCACCPRTGPPRYSPGEAESAALAVEWIAWGGEWVCPQCAGETFWALAPEATGAEVVCSKAS